MLVHVLEMLRVAGVLSNILNMDWDVELYLPRLGPVLVTNLLDDRNITIGFGACWVEPHIDLAIRLAGYPVLHLGSGRDGLAVGNVLAAAVGAKLPAVERALNDFADYFAVNAQMRSKVGAVGIVNAGFA